jgi:hypothetical protein
MADAEFWRKLAKKFRNLDPQGRIGLAWSYFPSTKRFFFRLVYDKPYELLVAKFEVLVATAGREINALDCRQAWLIRIHMNGPDKKLHTQPRDESDRRACINGAITNPCEISAIICLRSQAFSISTIGRPYAAPVAMNPAVANSTALATPDSIAEERKRLLVAYKLECKRLGVKVTDDMIAKAASPTWTERTPVTWWKRNDPLSKPAVDHAIRRVLIKKPHLPKN